MMKITTPFSLLFVLTVSGVSGCLAGPGEYERYIKCQYSPEGGEPSVKSFCVVAGSLCWNGPDPSDLELCSWNWFLDDQHMEHMEVLQWDQVQSCSGDSGDGSGLVAPTGTFPEWWGNNDPKSDGCVGQAPGGSSGGSGQTSATSGGDPTTGAPTTTDGSSGTTGDANDSMGDYYCSLRSPHKCADISIDGALGNDPYNRDPVSFPNDGKYDACWTSTVNLGAGQPQLSKCVYNALSRADARSKCEMGCDELNETLGTQCQNAGCTVVKPIDCVLEGDWTNELLPDTFDGDDLEMPHKFGSVANWACDGEPLVIGDGPFTQFEGSGTFISPDGTSAGMADVHGFLSYSLSNCTATTCTITIDTLVGLTGHAEGGYTDAAGSGGTYEVQQMGFQSRGAFSGTWDKVRETVTFPTAALPAQFWAGPVLIDGVSIGDNMGVANADIDQIVGSMQTASGPLTLNLTYEISLFGTVSASLHTVL